METEVKPCPFCGKMPVKEYGTGLDGKRITFFVCPTYHGLPDAWNVRPTEDAQAARIAELEAQLAAVPKWTRITDDPATWPPEDLDDVLFANPNEDPRWIWDYNVDDDWNRGGASYWLPITPPVES